MKKDIIIAIIIGFFIGVIFAIIVINIFSFINSKSVSDSPLPSPTNLPKEAIDKNTGPLLEIKTPKNGDFFTEAKIKVEGKTNPNNILVVETDKEAKITKISDQGDFSEEIEINEGGNNLYLSAYNKKGENTSKIISVFYTKEKL